MDKTMEVSRLAVKKTYKLYIGGKFPRTESGRYFKVENKSTLVANMCQASRKDLRNAVQAARKAFVPWKERSAFNRGQILYRIAEMLEGRKVQFVDEIVLQGFTKTQAKKELDLCIDRIVYYAGWSDKFQQVFSSVNPVVSSHFNFSVYEPTGVVFAFVNPTSSLLSLITSIMPIICSGNSCIVLANEKAPLSAMTFAEVLHSSDVPAGVVNILTGFSEELCEHAASHMDINAISYAGDNLDQLKQIKELSAGNVKRVLHETGDVWNEQFQSPYKILNYCELKTTWHPIEKTAGLSASY